ncbi:MAG: hypothetical protein Q4F79_07525 [Eubacteriales bacterium]|nr:hypothetical protein [Eubacteriales bacterium]
MTQKELDTLEHNRRQLRRLQSQLDGLCDPVGAAPMTGMPSGGGGGNTVETLVIQQESIREEINTLRQESRRICFAIEPPRTRRVFLLFYAEGKSWRRVADEMGYSEGSTPRRLRNEYLKRQNLR